MISQNQFSPNPDESDINELFQELIAHGSSLFGVGVHETTNDASRRTMIHKHWHREMEILYIKTNGLLVDIGTESFVGEEGDIFFIPSNLLHSAMQKDGLGSTFYAIVFDMNFLSSFGMDRIQQQYLGPLQKSPGKFVYHFKSKDPQYNQIQQLVKQIIDAFGNQLPGFELLIKGLLYQFIYYLSNHISTTAFTEESPQDVLVAIRIKQILSYIEEHYTLPISLKAIAKEVDLSEQYFCRFFKKYFHTTFNSYLTQYRLNRAEVLLKHTQMPIIEVAMAVGFESANYFTIVFKKNKGQTPSEYRETEKLATES